MPKLTVHEMKKMREASKKEMSLREGNFRGKLIVHLGTCGIAAGAREIMDTFLEEIDKRLPGYPLVMHGSSSVLKEFKDLINKYGGSMPDAMGVPEDAITKASKLSVCKVNIDTDLRMALTAKIRQIFAEKPAEFDPRKYLGPGRDAIKEMVKHKLRVLGCNGKAAECS